MTSWSLKTSVERGTPSFEQSSSLKNSGGNLYYTSYRELVFRVQKVKKILKKEHQENKLTKSGSKTKQRILK